jgi:hypothetical protein
MTRIEGLDARYPTLSPGAVRVVGGQFDETDSDDTLGTWTLDVFVPAYGVIQDIIIDNEVVWGATAATLVAGDYEVSSGAVGDALDADGFYTAVDLTSGGTIAAGGALCFANTPDAVDGAYKSLTDVVEANGRIHTADRFIRIAITTGTAAGTQAGSTFAYVVYSVPEMTESTFTAA